MTQTTMAKAPTARLMERDGRYRAFCNDCQWSCPWMEEAKRDNYVIRHMNLHRVSRGLERIEIEEPKWE